MGCSITSVSLFCSQAVSSGDEKEGLKHPGLMLKYSTYKNLAQLAAQREDLETAMAFYLEVLAPSMCLKLLGTRVRLLSRELKRAYVVSHHQAVKSKVLVGE